MDENQGPPVPGPQDAWDQGTFPVGGQRGSESRVLLGSGPTPGDMPGQLGGGAGRPAPLTGLPPWTPWSSGSSPVREGP